jgi:exopolysaccharide biosynthesis WecB/TagA/CpsF family protein
MDLTMDFKTTTGRIGVNITDKAALTAEVQDRFARREGFALATLNLDHLVKLGSQSTFATAYAKQDLVTADGNPIVWMSALAGRPVSLLPGADLVLPLASMAAQAGLKVALVGSTQESLKGAEAALVNAIPGVIIAARIAPPMGFDPEGPEAEAILKQLADLDIGLCFVALGAPKQEVLAALGRRIAPRTGFASIGAGLDFLSGHQNRAPRIVRQLALEWLWRAVNNPRRLALRYLQSAMILPGHALRAIGSRL